MNKPQTTWLSQEAYDRLKDELADLITNKRSEIAKKIQEAREEGDLSENGGYQAAKEEQGRIEARINRLEEMLANSEVGEAPESHGIVEQGVVGFLRTKWKCNQILAWIPRNSRGNWKRA